MKRTLAAIGLLIVGLAWAQDTAVDRPSENIALGASYTMEPAPNYEHCTDAADVTQLTDGVYDQTAESLWTQLSTVGWVRVKPVILTLDLGTVRPIRGISFHTAAGASSVKWPEAIFVFTAGEDKKFHEIGELVGLSAAHGPPLPTEYGTYGTHRYWTDQLRTHGRYVSLVVWPVGRYAFVDEIEVYAGEPEWVNEPLPGPGFTDVEAHSGQLAIQVAIRRRFVQDIQALKKATEEEGVPVQTQQDVHDELTAVEGELGQACRAYGEDFRAVLPLNSWHERVLRTQAWLWRARGLEPLTFWRSDLWDPLPLIGMPDTAPELSVEVHLMRKEYRAAAFNVSNSSDESAQVRFRLRGLPGGDNPEYVTVHEVGWTDTRSGVPVAAALPQVSAEDNLYTVTVPSGMTRQVWLTFHPVEVEPGTYEGEVLVESAAGGKRFPLRMHLYPLDFPEKQSLHLGGWDYTHETISKTKLVTEQNQSLIVQHLRERFVDSPWGSPRLLNPSYPDVQGTYDAQGAMTAPPNTAKFDAWLELWPGAAQYLVFVRVGDRFTYAGDEKYSWAMDTPEFATAVKAWVTFWAGHAVEKGLKPEQLALLLVDEPNEVRQADQVILAWAKAIREADTGVRIWEDPTYRDMSQATEAMIDACHVLCPHLKIFLNASTPIRPPDAAQEFREYYLKKRDQGIELEFYNADGPARLLDPYAYYRLTAWWCWRYGATGMYFWSLTDAAGASSWNEYLAKGTAYTPLFIAEDSVTAGKHLEAQREGVEDYEYFVMLDRAIREASAQGATGPDVAEARQLLESVPASVCEAAFSETTWWLDETMDRTLADGARIRVLAALMKLAER